MKVLEGGNVPTLLTPKLNELQKMEKEESAGSEETDSSESTKQFFRFMKKVVLKKDSRNDTKQRYEKPTLDISLPHVCSLSVQPSKVVDNG